MSSFLVSPLYYACCCLLCLSARELAEHEEAISIVVQTVDEAAGSSLESKHSYVKILLNTDPTNSYFLQDKQTNSFYRFQLSRHAVLFSATINEGN
jgi:hypothetical protein